MFRWICNTIILIIANMSGYDKIFKVKDGDKDKSNKLISSL